MPCKYQCINVNDFLYRLLCHICGKWKRLKSRDFILLLITILQTTRVFSPWKSEVRDAEDERWHEMARPQVHGHDINCVAIVQGKGNHRFVSGAEEKVLRVFEAPLSFLKTLNHTIAGELSFPMDLQADMQVLGANMSALGLSQKPIYVHGEAILFYFSFKKCISRFYL